jgi:hypothetical protein
MNRRVRTKLERAARVREFCRAHPSEDPAYATGLASLEENLTRAEAIAAREHQGLTASRTARARRRELRKTVHTQLLHYLVAVVDRGAKERPDLAEAIRLPRSGLTYRGFVTTVKGMLAAAEPEKAFLMTQGMSDSLLADLGRLVGDLETASEGARTSRRDHMGARADFDVVSEQLLKDVRVLSGIYHYRFGTDQQLMAEWDSVRQVPGLPRPKLTVEIGGAVEQPKQEKDGTASPGQSDSTRVA